MDYTEFSTATLDWEKTISEERLEKTFKVFDTDINGKISINDPNSLNRAHVEHIIKSGQIIDEGEIDFQKFKQLMNIKDKDLNRI